MDLNLDDIITRLQEYGDIYSNIRSDPIKQQLIQTAPAEVLDAFAMVAKNVLIGHINLSKTEFSHLRSYKEALSALGFQKQSAKRRRELLLQGDLLQSLGNIMKKLRPE
jgi:hypothetical protein